MYAVFGSHKTPLQTLNPENPLKNGRLFHELSIGERLTLVHCLCTSKVVSLIYNTLEFLSMSLPYLANLSSYPVFSVLQACLY